MGLRINTNVTSQAAVRTLSNTNKSMEETLQKLSSGERIVRAKDDAAGLAISEKFRGHIRSMRQAERNASDGIGMVQTAEGGLNEITNILIRLRELSIQAASDTVGDLERSFSNKEFQQLKNEIQRIAQVTNFNGLQLLDGNGHDLDFQVGIMNDEFQDRITYQVGLVDATVNNLGLDGTSVADRESARTVIETVDSSLSTLSNNRSYLGALQNRLQSTINNLRLTRENITESNSRIRDVEVAEESSELVKKQILQQAGVSVLAQANQTPMAALKLLG